MFGNEGGVCFGRTVEDTVRLRPWVLPSSECRGGKSNAIKGKLLKRDFFRYSRDLLNEIGNEVDDRGPGRFQVKLKSPCKMSRPSIKLFNSKGVYKFNFLLAVIFLSRRTMAPSSGGRTHLPTLV